MNEANPLPAVDLSGLDHDQQVVAETMPYEECESFSSDSEKDICCISDLEMEINLKDNQPLQKTTHIYPLTSVPRGETMH